MSIKIGDKVKVIDQEITGTVVRYDCGNKLVVLDDDDSWQEQGHEATLIFKMSDLIKRGENE